MDLDHHHFHVHFFLGRFVPLLLCSLLGLLVLSCSGEKTSCPDNVCKPNFYHAGFEPQCSSLGCTAVCSNIVQKVDEEEKGGNVVVERLLVVTPYLSYFSPFLPTIAPGKYDLISSRNNDVLAANFS